MDILAGILLLIIGAGLASSGLRLWFWMLPILGFIAGFFLGAILVYQLAGDGILATVLSWIAGVVGGVAFALISWYWWYFGVIIAAGSAGATIASGIAASLGAERQWVLLLVAIIGAALFAVAALVLDLPTYLVIINTAIIGALAIVTGLLLLFNRIDRDTLGAGHAVAIVNDSPGWWLLWIALAGIGIAMQLRSTMLVALPAERYVRTSSIVRPRPPTEQHA